MAKIIELIITDTPKGEGTPDSPVRREIQLFTKDGRLLVARDPCDAAFNNYVNESALQELLNQQSK